MNTGHSLQSIIITQGLCGNEFFPGVFCTRKPHSSGLHGILHDRTCGQRLPDPALVEEGRLAEARIFNKGGVVNYLPSRHTHCDHRRPLLTDCPDCARDAMAQDIEYRIARVMGIAVLAIIAIIILGAVFS